MGRGQGNDGSGQLADGATVGIRSRRRGRANRLTVHRQHGHVPMTQQRAHRIGALVNARDHRGALRLLAESNDLPYGEYAELLDRPFAQLSGMATDDGQVMCDTLDVIDQLLTEDGACPLLDGLRLHWHWATVTYDEDIMTRISDMVARHGHLDPPVLRSLAAPYARQLVRPVRIERSAPQAAALTGAQGQLRAELSSGLRDGVERNLPPFSDRLSDTCRWLRALPPDPLFAPATDHALVHLSDDLHLPAPELGHMRFFDPGDRPWIDALRARLAHYTSRAWTPPLAGQLADAFGLRPGSTPARALHDALAHDRDQLEAWVDDTFCHMVAGGAEREHELRGHLLKPAADVLKAHLKDHPPSDRELRDLLGDAAYVIWRQVVGRPHGLRRRSVAAALTVDAVEEIVDDTMQRIAACWRVGEAKEYAAGATDRQLHHAPRT